MSNKKEFNKAVDDMIRALEHLRSFVDLLPKEPEVPVEAEVMLKKNRCLYCGDPLVEEPGRRTSIRGVHVKCHQKVRRMIEAKEITARQAIERGYWLPAEKGGRPTDEKRKK